jgi:hypothetical protein
MDTEAILTVLKELTLDFVNAKRNRQETVIELRSRIKAEEIYQMPDGAPSKDLIREAFVSLDNLTEEGFAPSVAEIKYFAECFENQREFSQEEVRNFPIGSFEKEHPKTRRVK